MDLVKGYRLFFDSVVAIVPQYLVLGRWSEARALLDTAFTMAHEEARETPDIARLQIWFGAWLICQEKYETAIATLSDARRVVETAEETALFGMVLDKLGEAYYWLKLLKGEGEYTHILSLYKAGLAVRERTQDRAGVAESLFHVGLIAQRQDDRDTAVSYFRQAQQVAQEIDDKIILSYVVRHLGFIHERAGDLERAWSCFEQSLTLRLQTDFKLGSAFAHTHTARFLRKYCHDMTQARDHCKAALSLAQNLRHRSATAVALHEYGLWYEHMGNLEAASNHYLRALEEAVYVGNIRFQTTIRHKLEQMRHMAQIS